MATTKTSFGQAVAERVNPKGKSDTLEVVLLHQITGTTTRYVGVDDEGNPKYETKSWPKPGERIRLPREEALGLIHNELAYPTSGRATRLPDAIERAIASQDES